MCMIVYMILVTLYHDVVFGRILILFRVCEDSDFVGLGTFFFPKFFFLIYLMMHCFLCRNFSLVKLRFVW
jgi:hypothetical protein